MAFAGPIPQPMRALIAEHAKPWAEPFYVVRSGDFTAERVAAAWDLPVHAQASDIYSAAVGLWLAGREVPHQIADPSDERVAWMAPYLDGGIGSVATIMLASRWVGDIEKPDLFFIRQTRAYRAQWERLHAETVERLKATKVKLASFYLGGPLSYLRGVVPEEAPVVAFPPTAEEKDGPYKALRAHFTWPEPDDALVREDEVDELLDLITARPRWMVATADPSPWLAPTQDGLVKPSPGAKAWHVYSSQRRPRLQLPTMPTAPFHMPRLGPGEEIGERITLHRLTRPQFVGLRSQYLNPHIRPSNPDVACAVAVDGRMVGVFGLTRWQPDPSYGYILCDFPVAGTDYPRLTKLIVFCAISREARGLMQQMYSRELPRIATTAFTERSTSAKYGRGVPGMKLYLRKVTEDGKNALTYTAPFGQWSIEEAYAMWRDKQGERKPGRRFRAAVQ